MAAANLLHVGNSGFEQWNPDHMLVAHTADLCSRVQAVGEVGNGFLFPDLGHNFGTSIDEVDATPLTTFQRLSKPLATLLLNHSAVRNTQASATDH